MIDFISNLLIIVTVIVALGGVGVIVARAMKKKKGQAKSKGAATEAIKFKDASEFIPIEYIRDGVIKFKGEDRWVASVSCKGFDYATTSYEDKLGTQNAYYSFLNVLRSPVTMRIDSTAVDLNDSIMRCEEALIRMRNESSEAQNEFRRLSKAAEEVREGSEEFNVMAAQLVALDSKIEILSSKIAHFEELVEHQQILSGKEANPIQEERYIFEWRFDPSKFPDTITDAEIEERALNELNSQADRMQHALASANVKCYRDNDEDLYNLSYRHFHPYGSGLYKYTDITNHEHKLVSGKRAYEKTLRHYREEKQKEIVAKLKEAAGRILESGESVG